MIGLYFVLALVLVLVGHAFRLLRWEQFIRIYERPLRGQMLRGMAGGYALNFVLPFHLGDVFRAVFVRCAEGQVQITRKACDPCALRCQHIVDAGYKKLLILTVF